MHDYSWPETNFIQQGFAVVWVFGWAAFFLILRRLNDAKLQRKLDLIHKERLAAMEKGIPMPELPDYEEAKRSRTAMRRPLNPRWPLGLGAFSIIMGPGVSLALYMSGDPFHRQIWPFGLLGVFFGVGLIAYYVIMRGGADKA